MNETDSDGSMEKESTLNSNKNNLEAGNELTSAHCDPVIPKKDDPKSDSGDDSSSQSEDEKSSVLRTKKKMQVFSDSGGEPKDDTVEEVIIKQSVPNENDTKSETEDSDTDAPKNNTRKSRLRKMSSSGDESNPKSNDNKTSSNDEQESRITSKRNKLRQKFQTLASKKNKKLVLENNFEEDKSQSQSSNDEASSIEKLKQEIKARTEHLKSSVYDPDTSDEEETMKIKKKYTNKKVRKSTKPTSPKPIRMSAKQAMENMQKIKSESNRMLREKEVSLPYHRPKALSLKDIMNRQRTAVTVDGKALPIKMNEEQLKQYSQLLEQRQKEMIELCKSDSEEEEVDNTNNITERQSENQPEMTEIQPELSLQNDSLFDNLPNIETQTNTVEADNFENTVTNEAVNIENTKKDSDINIGNPDHDSGQTDISKAENRSKINDVESVTVDVDLETNISKENEAKTVNENNSMEMELVYNDSLEDTTAISAENSKNTSEDNCGGNAEVTNQDTKPGNEEESQLILLHYDTERIENKTEKRDQTEHDARAVVVQSHDEESKNEELENNSKEIQHNGFSDDDLDMDVEDIDALIENAEITTSLNMTGNVNSPMLIKETISLSATPKLTGAPGMVIDLDGTDPLGPRKLTGVELLKERFVYFSKLKTPEELEREKERRIKPGMQHLKLKQDLEEQIAEQRSLEWAKRLEESKAHKHDGSEAEEEDIDKIEAKLEQIEKAVEKESCSESEEEEEEESETELVDKPKKRNPMVDDEAEESDCDEVVSENKGNDENEGDEDNNADDEADESEEESSDESEESEDDQQSKPKKGRILKAFEDSDDEDTPKAVDKEKSSIGIKPSKEHKNVVDSSVTTQEVKTTQDAAIQDDELNLAQKSMSEDLFTSQDSCVISSGKTKVTNPVNKSLDEKELGTQSFSILETTRKGNNKSEIDFSMPDTLSIQRDTQSYDDNLDHVVGMCSGSFSQTQNLVPISQNSEEISESQAIGDDVLALCTGQFYDNKFVSQVEMNKHATDNSDTSSQLDEDKAKNSKPFYNESEEIIYDKAKTKEPVNIAEDTNIKTNDDPQKKTAEDQNLKTILDELNDPEFEIAKKSKLFVEDKENKQSVANGQFKKKFVIDSDEEVKEGETESKKKKKIKKKKLEQRALHISDDEEDEDENEDADEYESELDEEDGQRIVEYDSEENEVIMEPENRKKRRKLGELFEREAELTSEDEWMGSGDEDEAGLDRMEREEGDDDTFDQKQLQAELGQIHMRDVLDQDKREVRLIQELLFEDGDLGSGSRQRKFRWRNADGEEETGATYDELADTQEEEFESEEQWRKQRHEREMFLKTLKTDKDAEESLTISINRTSIIKANLSKNSSNLFVDINTSIEEIEAPVLEKKTATVKDIPSPKKPFTIFKQNYHGSLLTRGRGALARLAALATPLAADDDAPKVGSLAPSSKRNFVFASIDAPAQDDQEPKVTKRKAEGNANTPRLVKKMRTEDKQKALKSSLLDQLKV